MAWLSSTAAVQEWLVAFKPVAWFSLSFSRIHFTHTLRTFRSPCVFTAASFCPGRPRRPAEQSNELCSKFCGHRLEVRKHLHLGRYWASVMCDDHSCDIWIAKRPSFRIRIGPRRRLSAWSSFKKTDWALSGILLSLHVASHARLLTWFILTSLSWPCFFTLNCDCNHLHLSFLFVATILPSHHLLNLPFQRSHLAIRYISSFLSTCISPATSSIDAELWLEIDLGCNMLI